jgi:hypothetical protein
VDRTDENRFVPVQFYRRVVACDSTSQCISSSAPVVTAAVCGRALSWRRQMLLTDRHRRFERKAGFTRSLTSYEKAGLVVLCSI